MKKALRFMLLFMSMLVAGSSALMAEVKIYIDAPKNSLEYNYDWGAEKYPVPEDNVITLAEMPAINILFTPLEGYEIEGCTNEEGKDIGMQFNLNLPNGGKVVGWMLDAKEDLSDGCTLKFKMKGGEAPDPPAPGPTKFLINIDAPVNTLVYCADMAEGMTNVPEDNKILLDSKPWMLEIYAREGFYIDSCSVGFRNQFQSYNGFKINGQDITDSMTIKLEVSASTQQDFIINFKADKGTIEYSVDGTTIKAVPDDNRLVLDAKPSKSFEIFPAEGYEIVKCSMGDTTTWGTRHGYLIDPKDLTNECTIEVETKATGAEGFVIHLIAPTGKLCYSVDWSNDYINIPDNNTITLAKAPETCLLIMPLPGNKIASCSMGAPYAVGTTTGYLIDAKDLKNDDVIKVEVEDEVGIFDIQADKVKTYYNLQGMIVKNPLPGNIYIMRTGNVTAKVVK